MVFTVPPEVFEEVRSSLERQLAGEREVVEHVEMCFRNILSYLG